MGPMEKKPVLQLVKPPTGSIRPTTSRDTGRYNGSASIEPMHMNIAPGIFADRESAPLYLPPLWSAHVHPEGQLYFLHDSAIRTVTEAYLYRSEVLYKVEYWSSRIKQLMVAKNVPASSQIELFIRIDGEDCTYYLVDHVTRSEFWLDAIDTDDLNIAPVASPSHLKLALEELYWHHVENFPMHLDGLSQKSYDDLTCVFSHAYADHMTSRLSTFPYSAPDCKRFLKLLAQSRGHIRDGRTTCFAARLWTIVVRHWFSTHFGQEHARLSRDQAILAGIPENHKWKSLISKMTFKTSETYIAALDDLFVDHIIYATQWHPFMVSCLRDWRRISHGSILALMLHGLFFYSEASPVMAAISGALESASLVSSLLLTHRHEPLEDATASHALQYMSSVHSDQYGFQFAGLVYSLPKTFYFWGLMVFFANWMTAFNRYAGSLWSASCLSVLLVAFLAFQAVTSTGSWSVPNIWQVFSPKSRADIEDKPEESMV